MSRLSIVDLFVLHLITVKSGRKNGVYDVETIAALHLLGLHKLPKSYDIRRMAHTSDSPHTHSGRPCIPQDIDQFLDEAEELVTNNGQRMTKIRRKVLRLLAENSAPSKAYDLLANLDGEGAAKPPTIYRALEFLQEAGLAHKIESLNAYVACGHASHNHSAIFLICGSCETAEELNAEKTTSTLNTEVSTAGFSLDRAVIEVRGTCRNCAS